MVYNTLNYLNHWLALSKGPNRIIVSPSFEDRNRSSFQNVVFSSFFFFLEYRMMEKVQKPSNSDWLYMSDSMLLKTYICTYMLREMFNMQHEKFTDLIQIQNTY
jgi:hypothetical protein